MSASKPFSVLLPAILCLMLAGPAFSSKVSSMTMHGDAKYQSGFEHFDYVNPDAPKGGTLRMSAMGTFDSLNAYIDKGTSAAGLSSIYDTLMTSSQDEPFSMYPLLAQFAEPAADNSSITFHLNPKARFHDGKPVTAEDVVYTFNLLIKHGAPFYKAYYGDIKKVEALSKLSVRFLFKHNDNPELPLITSQLPVLPKHFWEKEENDFPAANLSQPLGSGPYRISAVDGGRSISYKRVKDYWGKDLPVNRGRHNFDVRRYDYYRDENVSLQALKAGEYDLRFEFVARNWATAYDIPAVKDGRLKMELIPSRATEGMQGFVYNLRRDFFADARVRRALMYAMDFEWLNRNLFFDSYTRSTSYFSNSEMAATGLPDKDELELLEPWRDQLPKELFTEPYTLPVTDGSGQIRPQLSEALKLLEEAGWKLDRGVLRNEKGEPFKFDILLVQASMERVVLPFRKNLSQLGIDTNIRTVDVSQYINRIRSYDFDILVSRYPQSSSPGNEQLNFWGSAAADQPGSRNLIGIKSPVVDDLIEKVITADSREELVTAAKALDRVLLWGQYVIPQWYFPYERVAYWTQVQHPKTDTPLYQIDLEAWWMGEQTDAPVEVAESGDDSDNPFTLWLLTGLLLLIVVVVWTMKKHTGQGR
ncbi:MAG: extracellular solute-binding protein [Endozoicomonas sp.]